MRVAIGDLAPMVGVRAACEASDFPRASFYRKGLGVVFPAAVAVRHVPRALVSAKPELLATGPNQLWSWDITKLLGPAKWTYFYLYVILDVFSRYVVAGWSLVAKTRSWPNGSSPIPARNSRSSRER
jgi:transposase InsO family protein